jgi:uncharacterized protein (DUF111 family)
MNEPIISGECAAYVFAAGLLGVMLLGALIALGVHIRRATLGKLLLDACAGDYATAVLAIENVKAGNAAFDESVRAKVRR